MCKIHDHILEPIIIKFKISKIRAWPCFVLIDLQMLVGEKLRRPRKMDFDINGTFAYSLRYTHW